ncbi:hypothetical protein C1S82_25715 [Mycolicibacterium cosmeticum]|uniref:Uncharacterized protein n=1 Tax=Mycolicibacterium cosmeticum TaxID=258533 RepID=W9AJA2_MYCCO|nr:hypothetical protein [Mycolicibacterium cosmeticum]TLH68857.1 hypothetical protein C1S82_25715 [Mycolicibacterium cosmeticum]CDO05533.1 hypothetical protein BN977_00307 [Mycolicibacterium cosmeticum]
MNVSKLKLLSAGVGGGAVVAMGLLAVGGGEVSRADPLPPGPVTTTPVTIGETVTETTAVESPEPTVYEPPVTFTTPSGFAVPH